MRALVVVRLALLSIALSMVTACSDGVGKTVDAAIDAPASTTAYTGDFVDWDDSGTNFCGVFGAKLTVHTDASRTDTTNPNGRFSLVIGAVASTQIDVVPPTAMSQCASGIGLYQMPGIMIIGDALLATGRPSSYRMIGVDRVAPFFASVGAPAYDPSKAILAGAIAQTEVDATVVPTMRDGFSARVAADCTAPSNPPTCGCATSSFGKTYLDLFDAPPKDCAISLAEVRNNSLIQSLLAPDVSIDGTMALSLGVSASAVPAGFLNP